jgi:hypothetical protein
MRISNGRTVEVVKFRETGLAALCIEVADYVRSGEAKHDDVYVDEARFEEDEHCFKVVFPR